MIKSFNDKKTYLIFKNEKIKRLDRDIQKKAFEKLEILDSAEDLKDLLFPLLSF